MKFQKMTIVYIFGVFVGTFFAMACGATGGTKIANAETSRINESTTLLCRGEIKITYSGSSGTTVIRGEQLDAQIEKDDKWLRVTVERQNKIRRLWVHQKTRILYGDTDEGNRHHIPIGECQKVDRETSKLLNDFVRSVMDSLTDETRFISLLPSEEQIVNLITCDGKNPLVFQMTKQIPVLKNQAKHFNKANAVKFEYIKFKESRILRSFKKGEQIYKRFNCEVRKDFSIANLNVSMDGKDTCAVIIDGKPYFIGQR